MQDIEQIDMLTKSLPEAAPADLSHQLQLVTLILGRSPDTVCDVAIDLWQRLSQGLVAIIGSEGFEALYDRSLHVAAAAHPWLEPTVPPQAGSPRFERLRSDLQSRDVEEAGKVMTLLLSTFTGVLSTLIGQQLTTNILRAAWGDAFEEAAQEISQWPKK